MQESVISTVVLPLAIFIIMVTLGMTLTVADFRRIFTQPKPVFIGLFCQIVLLPILGFAVAGVFGLTAVYAISLILLAVSLPLPCSTITRWRSSPAYTPSGCMSPGLLSPL